LIGPVRPEPFERLLDDGVSCALGGEPKGSFVPLAAKWANHLCRPHLHRVSKKAVGRVTGGGRARRLAVLSAGLRASFVSVDLRAKK